MRKMTKTLKILMTIKIIYVVEKITSGNIHKYNLAFQHCHILNPRVHEIIKARL